MKQAKIQLNRTIRSTPEQFVGVFARALESTVKAIKVRNGATKRHISVADFDPPTYHPPDYYPGLVTNRPIAGNPSSRQNQ